VFDLLDRKIKNKNGDKKTKFGSGEDKRAVSANLGAIFLLSFFSAPATLFFQAGQRILQLTRNNGGFSVEEGCCHGRRPCRETETR
jgi:hypothetical protein